jgi:hypothetical protein
MPSAFSASTAGGKAGFMSTLMTRGTGLPWGAQSPAEEAFGCGRVALRGEQEVNRLAGRIHRTV